MSLSRITHILGVLLVAMGLLIGCAVGPRWTMKTPIGSETELQQMLLDAKAELAVKTSGGIIHFKDDKGINPDKAEEWVKELENAAACNRAEAKLHTRLVGGKPRYSLYMLSLDAGTKLRVRNVSFFKLEPPSSPPPPDYVPKKKIRLEFAPEEKDELFLMVDFEKSADENFGPEDASRFVEMLKPLVAINHL